MAASRTLLQWLLACLKFTIDSEDLFCCYKQKKWFPWTKEAAQAAENWKPWRRVRFDLILMMRDIYSNSKLNPLTKFKSSSRSTKLKVIFPWNISQMIMKTDPISARILVSYMMKWGIPFWVWWKVNGNWDNNMIRISQWSESH